MEIITWEILKSIKKTSLNANDKNEFLENEFNEWNGEVLITSLKDKSMRKLNFQNSSKIEETIIFKDKIGRIRDIQVHPVNGKIYFLAGNSLWLMEKKK